MGNVTGPYWFLSEKGSSLTKKWSCVRDKLDQTNAEEYFDKMAEDYEEIVRQWGYNLPERVFLILMNHTEFSKDKTLNILDLGCGDGLFGFVMKVNNVTLHSIKVLNLSFVKVPCYISEQWIYQCQSNRTRHFCKHAG